MIEYADASDLLLRLAEARPVRIQPDLFGPTVSTPDGLQNKTTRSSSGACTTAGEHRTTVSSTSDARPSLRRGQAGAAGRRAPGRRLRPLRPRCLAAPPRRAAGRRLRRHQLLAVAHGDRRTPASRASRSPSPSAAGSPPPQRPVATAAQVDREVAERGARPPSGSGTRDGLALTDQLMAAYGPAMEVYGRYSKVLSPRRRRGQPGAVPHPGPHRCARRDRAEARRAAAGDVRRRPRASPCSGSGSTAATDVPKGEARFLAQADNLRLEDLRGPLLTESKSGFKLRVGRPGHAVHDRSSTFEVARAMAEGLGRRRHRGGRRRSWPTPNGRPTTRTCGRSSPSSSRQLPASDPVAKALTAVQRNAGTIGTMIEYVAAAARRRDGREGAAHAVLRGGPGMTTSNAAQHWADVLDAAARGPCLRRVGRRAADEPAQGRLPDRRRALPQGRLLRRHHPAHAEPGRVLRPGRPPARHQRRGRPALFHLDQGMGGGKSHALVGLYHMANNPERVLRAPNSASGPRRGGAWQRRRRPDRTQVTVTLTADYFSPGATSETFGPATNLFERFMWALVDGDMDRYQRYVAAGPNKGTLQQALTAAGRPVLILLDELMDYVMHARRRPTRSTRCRARRRSSTH